MPRYTRHITQEYEFVPYEIGQCNPIEVSRRMRAPIGPISAVTNKRFSHN